MLMDLCYTVMIELIIWSSVYSHSSEMKKKHNNKKKTWPQLLYGELNLNLKFMLRMHYLFMSQNTGDV